MNKIYENVFIGSFIYSLGFKAGTQHPQGNIHPVSINLFQQTPTDRLIGDLFGSLSGRNFIVEFKATNYLDEKEEEKQFALIKAIAKVPALGDLSRAAHFFAGGITMEKDEATLNFCSYIEAGGEPKVHSLNAFCEGIFAGKIQYKNEGVTYPIGVNGEDIKLYLQLLAELYRGDRRSSSGGLIINASNDGKITYLSTNNIFELTLTLDQLNTNLNQETLEYQPPSKDHSQETDFSP
jgi:hypothetical protein